MTRPSARRRNISSRSNSFRTKESATRRQARHTLGSSLEEGDFTPRFNLSESDVLKQLKSHKIFTKMVIHDLRSHSCSVEHSISHMARVSGLNLDFLEESDAQVEESKDYKEEHSVSSPE